jgi:hypothetical protein
MAGARNRELEEPPPIDELEPRDRLLILG